MTMDMNEVIKKLKKDVTDSIKNDILAVAEFHAGNSGNKENPIHAGYFSIARSVLCCVDFLGFLCYGRLNEPRKDTAKNAIKFLREYFPGDCYKKNAGLLYSMWRHGTVHSYAPISYEYDGISVYWMANNQVEDQGHEDAHGTFESLGKGSFRFRINTIVFARHLLLAVEELIQKLEKNSLLYPEMEKRYEYCVKPRPTDEIQNDTVREEVKEQIKKLREQYNSLEEIDGEDRPVSQL